MGEGGGRPCAVICRQLKQAVCQTLDLKHQVLTSAPTLQCLQNCRWSFIAEVPRTTPGHTADTLDSAATKGEGSMVPGPIDEFCESLRSELHARRAKSRAELENIRQLVHELELAREAAFVSAFAAPLKLRVPAHTGASASAIHSRLLSAVEALSEAASRVSPSGATAASHSAADRSAQATLPSTALGALPKSAVASAAQQPSPEQEGGPQPFPTLQRSSSEGPIVIVGGCRGEKLGWLPLPLRQTVEWIETTRQGTHAIGNLAQRIRQRRVLALIVLDGVVGHKHSEPLVAAAREVKIPTAYANKGGTGALARAFTQLEKMVGAP